MDDVAARKLRARVNRAVGQVEAVRRMVEEDRYCVDVLVQIAAARSALDALGIELLARHVETCIVGHGTGTEHACARPLTKAQLVAEVRTVLGRFLK